MKKINSYSLMLLLSVPFVLSVVPVWGAEKAAAAPANCHMKFPAIREETLHRDRPILKDATDGDIIDFYGP